MRKISLILVASVFALFIFGNFSINHSPEKQSEPGKKSSLPSEVTKVVEKSCRGCHNSGSMNEKAKNGLSFDKLDSLDTVKRIGKIKDIYDIVGKGEMPPKQFLDRFPDRKLSGEESKILTDWAKKEIGL
jgi:hypothetical protein